jgi:hypothetical protein
VDFADQEANGSFSIGLASKLADGLPLPRCTVGFHPMAETRPMVQIYTLAFVPITVQPLFLNTASVGR